MVVVTTHISLYLYLLDHPFELPTKTSWVSLTKSPPGGPFHRLPPLPPRCDAGAMAGWTSEEEKLLAELEGEVVAERSERSEVPRLGRAELWWIFGIFMGFIVYFMVIFDWD